jgi:hypothetical protein
MLSSILQTNTRTEVYGNQSSYEISERLPCWYYRRAEIEQVQKWVTTGSVMFMPIRQLIQKLLWGTDAMITKAGKDNEKHISSSLHRGFDHVSQYDLFHSLQISAKYFSYNIRLYWNMSCCSLQVQTAKSTTNRLYVRFWLLAPFACSTKVWNVPWISCIPMHFSHCINHAYITGSSKLHKCPFHLQRVYWSCAPTYLHGFTVRNPP